MTPFNYGFIKVAAAVPALKIADIEYNTAEVLRLAEKADKQGAQMVVFPELCITGYTLGDLFHQRVIHRKVHEALDTLKKASKNIKSLLIIGAPLESDGKLFNAGVVVGGGKIWGVLPKTYIPGYKEFYEERWFAAARDLTKKEIKLAGSSVPIGNDLLFRLKTAPEMVLGIEICEDMWVPIPPSSYQVLAGANVIANLSASNDLVGKADYRKNLVSQQSARGICGYVYASCGVNESTTDLVFGGHAMIAENGYVLNESKRFLPESQLIISEIDLEHLSADRTKMTSFGESSHESPNKNFRVIDVPLGGRGAIKSLSRKVETHPFVPQNLSERDKRAEEIFNIQSAGLAKRLKFAGIKKMVIGVSGGLDSALALLVSARVCQILNLPIGNIHAFTLPGFATTRRTKSNAIKLAKLLGATVEEVDITPGANQQLKDIKHKNGEQDLTFQNVQARYRTMVLMNKANQIGGLVVGTGDLSEIALGWNTYTGDHISHYNVNAGVPKTLVKYLVEWVSEWGDFKKACKILKDIIDTPISPELVRSHKKDITQKTEELIGPYELHDFFLYHFVRWGSEPSKIIFLTEQAFGKKYNQAEITKWLKLFIKRFFQNQWKRSVMPDGPKVGSVALSPRGDWRMPSDAEATLWLKNLN